MIRPTRRKTQGQHLKAWVVDTILARTEPTKAQSVKVLKAGLQDISVPGHFGTDLEISALTWTSRYSVLDSSGFMLCATRFGGLMKNCL
jgi:hypothetical protein